MKHLIFAGSSLCVCTLGGLSQLLAAFAFAAIPLITLASPVTPAEPPAAHFKAGHGLQFTAKARAFANATG